MEKKISSSQPRGRRALLEKHRSLIYVLPFLVFMLVGSLEPTPETPGGAAIGIAIPYEGYPVVYTLKIALTVAAIVFVWPGYRQFPPRVTLLGILVGLVGAAIWIGLAKLQLEQRLLVPLGLGQFLDLGRRSAFNPLAEFDNAPAAWSFLAVRLVGLVAVVPVIEEFFLRGFVMRFLVDANWWKVPFGEVNRTAVVAGTLVPMLAHPAELFAAAVWFSLVTWLMVRTRSIWDCVAAHVVTNLVLGIYVILSGNWFLM
jgi:CAAX prenyl protease-like protein